MRSLLIFEHVGGRTKHPCQPAYLIVVVKLFNNITGVAHIDDNMIVMISYVTQTTCYACLFDVHANFVYVQVAELQNYNLTDSTSTRYSSEF